MKQTVTNSMLTVFRNVLCTGITAAVMAIAPQSFGQASTCNPAGPTITISPAATTFAVGQKPRINVQFGTSTIEGGTQAEITTLQVSLDCASGTNPCSICNDEGQVIKYSGDATIDFNPCGGITDANVASNVPGGGAATNVIVFTFNPPIVLGPNQTCNLSFEVEVLAVGPGGSSPKVINGFAEFEGECDNEAQFLNGCGTYSYPITNPGIQVVKNVSDDLVCEGEPVTYTYAVSIPAPFNSQLCNIVLEDDNATPGNTADDFNPTFTGGDTNGNSCLDVGETWTYSHGPVVLPVGTYINTAVVSGDYTNAAGTITKTAQDDAQTQIKTNPSVEIVGEAICANRADGLLCAIITGGRGPYTVCWYDDQGVLIPDSCEVVTNEGGQSCIAVADEASYCAVATDDNGCISGEPGDDCGSIDINPNPMVKVTADTVCEDDCGDLTATVGGGTAPYSVQWFDGSDNPVGTPCNGLLDGEQCVLPNICDDGVYTAKVTDAEGCLGQDSGSITFNDAPSCSIDTNPGVCETEYCVVTDACQTFTVLWSGPNEFESTDTCITLGLGDDAGTYSVVVTDCNGCVSEGPCQINFNPPVPPSCNIEPAEFDDCEITYCVTTDACTSFTIAWEGPNGYSNTGPCITLGQGDDAGTYTATVTDCNGCESSCPVNFTPPVSPTCEISVGACPFPRLLTVTPSNCTDCTYQWGNGSAAACTPIGGATGNTYSAPAPGTYCVIVTSSNGCTGVCEVVVEDCQEAAGCTPGYWRQPQHWWAWTEDCPDPDAGCAPATKFSDVFEDAFPKTTCGGTSKTLLKVLRQPASEWVSGCGSNALNNLGRHTVAALLNATNPEVSPGFPYTRQQVIEAFNAVYPGTNSQYNTLKDQFASANEAGCPIGNAPGDLNGSFTVDGDDLRVLLNNWGNPGTGDINRDGKVDSADLILLMGYMAQ